MEAGAAEYWFSKQDNEEDEELAASVSDWFVYLGKAVSKVLKELLVIVRRLSTNL